VNLDGVVKLVDQAAMTLVEHLGPGLSQPEVGDDRVAVLGKIELDDVAAVEIHKVFAGCERKFLSAVGKKDAPPGRGDITSDTSGHV
jgi:hypothetical protein